MKKFDEAPIVTATAKGLGERLYVLASEIASGKNNVTAALFVINPVMSCTIPNMIHGSRKLGNLIVRIKFANASANPLLSTALPTANEHAISITNCQSTLLTASAGDISPNSIATQTATITHFNMGIPNTAQMIVTVNTG